MALAALMRGDRQRRLEDHRSGRWLISAFVAVTVGVIVVEVLPEQVAAPTAVRSVTQRYVRSVGLWQPWSVFTPPRREVLELRARVTFADGSTAMWHLPKGDPVIGSYSDYHWLKYAEHAALRGNADEWPRLREPLARFVASEMADRGRVPVQVTLITERTENLPIDSDGPDRADARVDEYYTLELGGRDEGR